MSVPTPPNSPWLADVKARLSLARRREIPALSRRLANIEKALAAGKPQDRNLKRLAGDLDVSIAHCELRRQSLPTPKFTADLPILSQRESIIQTIRDHQVCIVCGETGSGKSTQLPQLCLAAGLGEDGLIGHTQPRRIAARSIAKRVADELGVSLGKQVGYKIRFGDVTARDTCIKLMTDGILLNETQTDPLLEQYDAIIIDEAHERSLNIDFLIGLLKNLLPRRPDLRLIITSATIDPKSFSEHFDNAPIIEVSGRTYPVEVRYRPVEVSEDDDDTRPHERALLDAVDELSRVQGGDTLIFMPSERAISQAAKLLRKHSLPGGETQILPLYSRLPVSQQDQIFAPHNHRRIVIATNVAESSLTVPGIRNVIDTGTARISRYAARSGLQRLPIEPVSQASANQRKGRCGRIGPGVCIRLYSEEDFANRDPFTQPEIQRTNLAAVILQMKAMRLGEPDQFPFIDPPKAAMVRDGYHTLYELGAIDENQKLTGIGKRLAKLPVDPRIGRIILAGHDENCLSEMLIIASLLAAQDPRERPIDQEQAADDAHKQFTDERSDFLTLLGMWDFYHNLKDKLSRSKLTSVCRSHFLSPNRCREWTDVHRQLVELARAAGLKLRSRGDQPDRIHRALLAGYLANLGVLTDKYQYSGAGGGRFYLWPGSTLFGKQPKWILAAEMIETQRRYARTLAPVSPRWIEPVAGHLIKKTHSDPHWDRKTGRVTASEKVSLFGLTIVPKRLVNFTGIDPIQSRQLFIQHALVEAEFDCDAPFFKANQQLIRELRSLEAKTRNREMLISQQRQLNFYERRVPGDVCDAASLARWLKKRAKIHNRILTMSREDLLDVQLPEDIHEQFPDTVKVREHRAKLKYQLQPGEAQDGVTLQIPVEVLSQIDQRELDWLVPGLVPQWLAALIRSLPKALRVHFVPAPDVAARAAAMIQVGRGELLEEAARALEAVTGQPVPIDAFDLEKVPEHLRINLNVIDDKGKTLAQGRDLPRLRAKLGQAASERLNRLADDAWQKDGLTTWSFGEMPESITLHGSRRGLTAYPALVDQQNAVGLRLFDTPNKAHAAMRNGLRRLCHLQLKKEIEYQINHHPSWSNVVMHHAALGDAKTLRDQMGLLIADRACLGDASVVRDPASFEERLTAGWNRIAAICDSTIRITESIFTQHHHLSLQLENCPVQSQRPVYEQVKAHANSLIRPGFLTQTPWRWLEQFPRYLAAMRRRLEKLSSWGLARDQQLAGEVAGFARRYVQRWTQHRDQGIDDPQLEMFRWMIEEFAVAQYAQDLGTNVPVSAKRLEKQWEKVRQ